MATRFEARTTAVDEAEHSGECDAGAALSASELEVASLAAQGLSNVAIARARGCAQRTVANHLSRIYEKLGISGRRELRATLPLPLCLATLDRSSHVVTRALSGREREILLLAAEGESNKSVAYALGISLSSVSTYLRRARWKLGVAHPELLLRPLSAGPVARPRTPGCPPWGACESERAQQSAPSHELATEDARGCSELAEWRRHSSG